MSIQRQIAQIQPTFVRDTVVTVETMGFQELFDVTQRPICFCVDSSSNKGKRPKRTNDSFLQNVSSNWGHWFKPPSVETANSLRASSTDGDSRTTAENRMAEPIASILT